MTELDRVTARLAAAGCVAARAEAHELLADLPDDDVLEARLRRREAGEPLSWITGRTTFAGRSLRVVPGVYEPRPQTQLLAERAAARLPGGGSVVDLCTGAGAVGAHLAAADPAATVVGVDLDPDAARCAATNGLLAVIGDVDAPLASRSVDVVTAVAPYVPTAAITHLPPDVQRHEPRRALDGGVDGLAVVRRVVLSAARLLRPGGWLLVELGGDQGSVLAPDLAAAGFGEPTPWADDDGDLRGLEAQLA